MSVVLPRNTGYICRVCRTKQLPLSSLLLRSRQYPDVVTNQSSLSCKQKRAVSSKAPTSRPSRPPISRTQVSPRAQSQPQTHEAESSPAQLPQFLQSVPTPAVDVSISAKDIQGTLRDIQTRINAICASTRLPEDVQILEVMEKAYQFANVLVFGQTSAPDEETVSPEEEDESAKKDLFSELEEATPSSRKLRSYSGAISSLPTSYRERSSQTLCEAIYTLLKDPKVMITETLLETYVRIICQLGSPEYLPEIFFLYANKSQPVPGSNPIQYRNTSPNSPKNAIPQTLSDVALDTAILQRDLSLAVAIIDTTVATRAFRLSKFIRKASLPLGLVGSTPIAAYAAADWVSKWQNSLDPQMAKAITIMASAAYIGTLTTIGFVAVTTWNDHHERVRWTEGTPLRWRWMREEERLYFDRIAMAWGFQRRRRRGEEMGELWEELREECGVRGLVLDKSDLLPGMQ